MILLPDILALPTAYMVKEKFTGKRKVRGEGLAQW